MVNEARVKEQFKLARMDQNEEKNLTQLKTFFRGDYISKEMIKSIFAATLAFLFGAAIYLMRDIDKLMTEINQIDYKTVATQWLTVYGAFLAIYLILTYLIYALRYHSLKKRQDEYRKHLKKLSKIYQREAE